ncbi:MAG: fused MFS/spermidine synthase [Phycisphaerae bacterium]|nr:fused MFS/spermidine synthase [Phycisphaerae bacterium]
MGKLKESARMLVPTATVFFSAGCILVLGLTASRLVARDLGSSLYTWTSLLAVALAGVSGGAYLGGRIADRHDARRALAVLFGLASAACVGIVVVNNAIGDWAWLWRLGWPAHVLLHVLLVFLVPSILLGVVGPVAVKMALDQGRPAGRTIGVLCAWAAAGCIVGTLLAGFYLIPVFSTPAIIWGIAAVLLAAGVLYWVSCWVMYLWAMIFAALITMGMAPADWAQDSGTAARLRRPADPNVIYEDETACRHIAVRQTSRRPDRRVLLHDPFARSETICGDETYLQSFHTRVYAALTQGLHRDDKAPSMMVVGAGGYVFPRYLRAAWPGSSVEVIEDDPGVTAAAAAALGLDRNTPIRTVCQDARCHVEQLVWEGGEKGPQRRYDFIYMDALDGYAVPFQLLTREFNDKIARLLDDDGAYLLRLTDVQDNGRLLGAVVNTVKQTFPHVYVITVQAGLPLLRDPFVVVATRRRIDPREILSSSNRRLEFRLVDDAELDRATEQSGCIILTDDFAPVEQLSSPVVRRGAAEILAHKRLREAASLQASRKCEQSVAKYREVIRLDPSLAVDAYREIGLIHLDRGQSEQAIAAFQDAIKAHAETGGRPAAVGEVHVHLGVFLDRMGRSQQSREHLARAVEWFRIELAENPGFVVVWDWLGESLAMTGDFKEASDAFERALNLEPSNPEHYRKLARALERQKRYSEAIAVAKKHIQLMQEKGDRDMANQLRDYLNLLEYNRVKQRR